MGGGGEEGDFRVAGLCIYIYIYIPITSTMHLIIGHANNPDLDLDSVLCIEISLLRL